MYLKTILVLLTLFAWTSAQRYKSLNPMLAWKVLEYGFPSDNERQYAIDNNLTTPNTGTPIDVGVQYFPDKTVRIFVTIPRFTNGIPFSLATVSNKVGANGPIINAYPNYDMNRANDPNCDGITSAFRMVMDKCNQMWVIDSGVVANNQICPPKLLVFDLNTDTIVKQFQFPSNLYEGVSSLLINLAVDIRDDQCQSAMVYVADVTKPGLIVYDSEPNKAWRIENKCMFPDPAYTTHTVAGESFDLNDGIFALNLSPRQKKGLTADIDPRIVNRPCLSLGPMRNMERKLYFHALASDAECAVPLRVIDNRTLFENNVQGAPDAFELIGHRAVQAAAEVLDSRGNMFANTEDPLSIFVWNIYQGAPYDSRGFKIVANNPEQLQFASAMKVVRNPRGDDELWVSTCRFQKIANGNLNPNEINFRILACKIDDLLKGKTCRPLHAQMISNSNSLYNNLILN